MPKSRLHVLFLVAFAIAAYVLTECGRCERCAAIDLSHQAQEH